jgi:hypothetical protein
MLKLSNALLVFAGLMSTTALAQSPDVPSRGQDRAPQRPASDQVIPEQQGQGSLSVADDKGRSLSDRLNTSDGVLRPKGDPDPGIRAKAPEPNPNSTPVIKPPGSPGGDQSIKPK